mgnify:CR=1 FL=1
MAHLVIMLPSGCKYALIIVFMIGIAIGGAALYYYQSPKLQDLSEKLEDYQEKVNYSRNLPYKLSISATSPCVANGTDFSKVTIRVWNIYNELIPGADLTLGLHLGIDIKYSYPVHDQGNGTYLAYVNSTIAGIGELTVTEINTGLRASTYVEFIPGPIREIKILDFTHPRDTKAGNTTRIYAVALDAYGNIVGPPTADIQISCNLGEVSPTQVDDYGRFYADINFTEFGIYHVIANETRTELTDEVYIDFPVIYMSTPNKAIVNDTITVPLSVYIPYDHFPLGFYNIDIIYDCERLHFEFIIDGDLYDAFEAPKWFMLNESTIRICQFTSEFGRPALGNVKIANLTFRIMDIGVSYITVMLAGNDIQNLLDVTGTPIVEEPPILTNHINGSDKVIHVKLKIWKVEDQVTEDKIGRDIQNLKNIYSQIKDKCGVKVEIDYEINTISKEDWRNIIDKDGDGRLDEYENFNNPTEEEKALLNNFYRTGYVNVYYIKEFDWKNQGGSGTTGEYVKADGRRGVIIDSDDSIKNTLAHEIGHYFKLDHVSDPNNLMYPYAVPTALKLTTDQCNRMVESMKDEFGDPKQVSVDKVRISSTFLNSSTYSWNNELTVREDIEIPLS